ncbi:uncharacterized protein LACBIDRAFT_335014 [Laccaria bicolor S238N-H82]|uniref:Predicted protein n=1 Tax=Laccaria bicolor (strain S238N-H82 / ATCC MYA-4686) TaxID=486041 RepID=B0E128_LACBS|nr:uncharacterized protein LACBIDRAFT_335012 [Laccaria bicolor S238N-H82]XP_001889896.1 uncharacterized protein LACBIDRAFT_335014 [Laccaria bicolor S238N-H82]EDQ99440.1 predicted protein [Laccaria bicolor S238N-H82]EDQ99441.1 predicted protein [Laccaria bicolor S238N-H82]|eukprot:XP_001889895.1 predicted protein [Laccaria bicolor S238N-H82]
MFECIGSDSGPVNSVYERHAYKTANHTSLLVRLGSNWSSAFLSYKSTTPALNGLSIADVAFLTMPTSTTVKYCRPPGHKRKPQSESWKVGIMVISPLEISPLSNPVNELASIPSSLVEHRIFASGRRQTPHIDRLIDCAQLCGFQSFAPPNARAVFRAFRLPHPDALCVVAYTLVVATGCRNVTHTDVPTASLAFFLRPITNYQGQGPRVKNTILIGGHSSLLARTPTSMEGGGAWLLRIGRSCLDASHASGLLG